MACLKENGTHPELRHKFIEFKTLHPVESKISLKKGDGTLSSGQFGQYVDCMLMNV